MRPSPFLFLLSLAGVPACSPNVTTPARPVTLVAIDDHLGQAHPVGTPMPGPLRVQAHRDGAPQAGVTVRWTTASGTLHPAESVTDAEGIATSHWTLGRIAGSQLAVSRTSESPRPAQFAVTATPGPVASLVKEAGDGQSLNLVAVNGQQPLRVRVLDQFANPVPLAEITWLVLEGPVALSGPPQEIEDGLHVQHVGMTGATEMAKVRAEVRGTTIGTVFDLAVALGPYVVALSNLGTYHQVGFRSLQNGTAPARDTMLAGGTVEFRQEDYWDVVQDHTIIAIGLPAIPSCLGLFDYDSICQITVTIPGVYRYGLARDPTIHGILVVQ